MSNVFDETAGAGNEAPDVSDGDGFMIVGLGASAGGIGAFRQFFSNVPARSGMAYVVILHLSPEHDSRLAEVLQSSTRMPVTQVNEQVRIEPDHVYVIPPNKSLSMHDGSLVLSDMTRVEERRAPVDIFFRTLAESHGARAACVVLSGTGANGSMGLKRVKEYGGVSVVQDPNEAEYSDMPRNSIATGLVDYVLPVAEMPHRLVSYRDTLRSFETKVEAPPAEPDERAEQDIAAILTQLRLRTGHDFTNYKRPTVRRRIDRRIGITQVADLHEYVTYIREHTEESRSLLKDLLISVTNFFRDRIAFQTFEKVIVPKLFEDKGSGGHVRVWVAGCATGEEAYSIAMLLTEYAESLVSPPTLQVFASDIDESAIQVARAGFYTANDAADVSPERLRRFFTKVREGYGVRRELREMVLFAQHNLLKDPPFSHIDLISCRNLLIYLNRTGQERTMAIFHFALNPGGYLFLGASETASDYSDLFAVVDKESHIFQARTASPRVVPQMAAVPAPRPTGGLTAVVRDDATRYEMRTHERLSYLDLHQRLLEMYAPPSVLVSAEHEIVHLSESAGRYITLPGGEPTYNLLAVVRPELRLELRSALYQAAQQRANVEMPDVRLQVGDRIETLRLVVRPVVGPEDTARGFFLILFEPSAEAVPASAENIAEVVRSIEPAARQLEEELALVRSQLRSTVEQYEVQHEELRASNEELQAMNEELRSTAEELETSKEELQSLNEELTTVNQELKIKIEEQGQTNSDLQNLIDSTEIATVFLDRSLRVRLFTPRAREIFNLIPTDVGRPLSDITGQFADGELTDHANDVLSTLRMVEREITTRDGRWRLMRVSPYRSPDDRILGVVITFVDITERKLTAEALQASEEKLRRAFEIDTVGIIYFKSDGLVTYANDAFLRMSGYTRGDVERGLVRWDKMTPPEFMPVSENAIREFEQTGRTTPYEKQYLRKDGSRWWGRFSATRIGETEGVEFITDITEHRRAERELRASEMRLHTVIESVVDYAIFTTDARGYITTWHTGAERVFGFTEREIVGRHTGIIFTPEDRAHGAAEEEMREARATGRAADERWHMRKDGSRFYASGVLSPLGDGEDTGFVKVARDLTAQKRADEELRSSRDEMERRVGERTDELRRAVETMLTEVKERRTAEEHTRTLVGRLVTAQEDERRRISRDLHDQLGQQLTALRLRLAALKEACVSDEALCAQVEAVQELAARVDSEVDFLAWELRPTSLDDLGLTAALANFIGEWSKHYNIPAEVHISGFDSNRLRLPPQTETCLYRITQEALNNITKYAQAARVSVLVERRGPEAVLVVEDDGVGFDADEKMAEGRSLGLVGMRERAALIGGSLEIEAAPGKGTTIYARVPAVMPEKKEGGDESAG
ncbi:MAG TPA: CheR family methyltransferase [Pyrinomonadaceae bacterium]|nr:CheR family methyltransferase [Pyrinomonadaceae bacterium]